MQGFGTVYLAGNLRIFRITIAFRFLFPVCGFTYHSIIVFLLSLLYYVRLARL